MSNYAKVAAQYLTAWCRATYEVEPDRMGSTMASGDMIDVFDHTGYVTHKYIPADYLTETLGELPGAGVYGAWRMKDCTYLLLTCRGELAYWSGEDGDHAHWHGLRKPEGKVQ